MKHQSCRSDERPRKLSPFATACGKNARANQSIIAAHSSAGRCVLQKFAAMMPQTPDLQAGVKNDGRPSFN
jgi:hypothetical protein